MRLIASALATQPLDMARRCGLLPLIKADLQPELARVVAAADAIASSPPGATEPTGADPQP